MRCRLALTLFGNLTNNYCRLDGLRFQVMGAPDIQLRIRDVNHVDTSPVVGRQAIAFCKFCHTNWYHFTLALVFVWTNVKIVVHIIIWADLPDALQISIPEEQRGEWYTIDIDELGVVPFANTLRIRIVSLTATGPYQIRNVCGFACVFGKHIMHPCR